MAARRSRPAHARKAITAARAGRLYRMVKLLGTGAQDRAVILRRLVLDLRGFYRDLGLLRAFGVAIGVDTHRYSLGEAEASALAKLPFPDPLLSLHEAEILARGRTPAHKKVGDLIRGLAGRPR